MIADNRARQDARQDDQQVRYRRNDESLDDDFDQDEMAPVDSQRDQRDQREAFDADDTRSRRNRNDRQPQRQQRYETRPARIEVGNAADDSEAPVREAPEREAVARQAPARDNVIEDAEAPIEAAAPKRRGRPPRAPRAEIASPDDAQPGIDLAALPPAIARADNDSDEGEAPAPRRRGRRPRAAAEAAE